ncbi:MAG: C2HC-type zinc finger protein, partial [Candidatus Aenigmarchaeota archaeon]|nr:C2HC-type zinc finger protein [Candidatus Aenigmarchaeota archaeon]
FLDIAAQQILSSSDEDPWTTILAVFTLRMIQTFGWPTVFITILFVVMLLEIIYILLDIRDNTNQDAVWECEYCGKEFDTKYECEKHEKTCIKRKK